MKPSNTMLRSRLVTLLAGAGAITYAFFVFVPGQQSIARLGQQMHQKKRDVAQANLLVQPIQQVQQKLEHAEGFAAQWRKRAPAGSHASRTLGQVIQHAESNRVEILRLEPQEENTFHTLRSIPFDVRVEGSYHCIYRMLCELETMQGVLWIEQLDLQHEDLQSDKLDCSMKLIIFADCASFPG